MKPYDWFVVIPLTWFIGTLCWLTTTSPAEATEPPCRQQVIPHSINAATIFHQTHLQIVEVPVPAFIFQTLQAYQPQPAPVQDSATTSNSGIGTNDMLLQLLDQQPTPSVYSPLAEIRQKCSSCHDSSGQAKGGLRLFNEAGEYAPTSNKQNFTRSQIAARVRSTGSDVMPPSARTDSSKRVSESAAAFLER